VNAGRTPVKFIGIHFTSGAASTGAGTYGEAYMEFIDCFFTDGDSKIDGGGVMVSRSASFFGCIFAGNRAKFAAGVRVSDIGSAMFTHCIFASNVAERRGGALATQIENAAKTSVTVKDSIFCFNYAPEGRNIFDFRDAHHTCIGCRYDDRIACCSGHGVVRPISDGPAECSCDSGWSGMFCQQSALHSEL